MRFTENGAFPRTQPQLLHTLPPLSTTANRARGEGWSQAPLHRGPAAPTSRKHLGALAEAVVVIRVAGAEVGSLEDHPTLLPGGATVALQGDPGGAKQREGETGQKEERRRKRRK